MPKNRKKRRRSQKIKKKDVVTELTFEDLVNHVDDVDWYERHDPGIYIDGAISEEQLKIIRKLKKGRQSYGKIKREKTLDNYTIFRQSMNSYDTQDYSSLMSIIKQFKVDFKVSLGGKVNMIIVNNDFMELDTILEEELARKRNRKAKEKQIERRLSAFSINYQDLANIHDCKNHGMVF